MNRCAIAMDGIDNEQRNWQIHFQRMNVATLGTLFDTFFKRQSFKSLAFDMCGSSAIDNEYLEGGLYQVNWKQSVANCR